MNQMLVFSIGGQQYALPIKAVERIIHAVHVTPLPETPDLILGVINMGGRIIPVANIRKLLGFPDREIDLGDRLIIGNTVSGSIALLVVRVAGLIDCPETASSCSSGTVTGIIKTKGDIIPVLDPDILSKEIEQQRKGHNGQ